MNYFVIINLRFEFFKHSLNTYATKTSIYCSMSPNDTGNVFYKNFKYISELEYSKQKKSTSNWSTRKLTHREATLVKKFSKFWRSTTFKIPNNGRKLKNIFSSAYLSENTNKIIKNSKKLWTQNSLSLYIFTVDSLTRISKTECLKLIQSKFL